MLDAGTHFDIAEDTNFVTARQPDNLLEQGTTLRLAFTDTVDIIREKVKAHLQAPADA